MKIRIQNDGGPGYMTQLTDVETGQTIEHATGVDVRLSINVRETPQALVTTLMPVIDVIADAEIRQVCPVCGKREDEGTETVIDGVKRWKARTLSERLQSEQKRDRERELSRIVYEALGEASMCWSETPKGVFDSGNADRIGKEVLAGINAHIQARLEEHDAVVNRAFQVLLAIGACEGADDDDLHFCNPEKKQNLARSYVDEALSVLHEVGWC